MKFVLKVLALPLMLILYTIQILGNMASNHCLVSLGAGNVAGLCNGSLPGIPAELGGSGCHVWAGACMYIGPVCRAFLVCSGWRVGKQSGGVPSLLMGRWVKKASENGF